MYTPQQIEEMTRCARMVIEALDRTRAMEDPLVARFLPHLWGLTTQAMEVWLKAYIQYCRERRAVNGESKEEV